MGLFSPDFKKLDRDNDILGIRALLRKGNSTTRLKAFNLLAEKLDKKEIFDTLEFMLNDRDREVKTAVVLAFCRLGFPGILNEMEYIVTNGRQEEKIRGLQALSRCLEHDRAGAAGLLFRAMKDDKLIVRIEAVKSLGYFKGRLVTERLIDRLHDENFQMRLEAVKSLAAAGGEGCVDHISGALVDAHRNVRAGARIALEEIGGGQASKALENEKFMKLVRAMNENYSVRLETVRDIGEKLIEEGLPLLVKTCRDEYKSIRIESVKAIGNFYNPAYTGTLVKMLSDRYWDIRLEAVRALEKIRDPGSLGAIETAMEDGNYNVRQGAKEAYNYIRKYLEKE